MTILRTFFKPLLLGALFFVPIIAFAQVSSFAGFVDLVVRILNAVIALLFAVALLVFFWGVAQFILNAGNEQKRTEGKGIMLWGIIALFVMVSLWGIIQVLITTLEF